MSPEERDPAYLWDMQDAAEAIRQFTGGVTVEEYERNLLIRSAVERQLEILGEAARRVSPAFKNANPAIPWRQIVGLRNILAHEYGDINQRRIWLIISGSIPALIDGLQGLLSPRHET
jgi:uncharacterized protein with HEPN domain